MNPTDTKTAERLTKVLTAIRASLKDKIWCCETLAGRNPDHLLAKTWRKNPTFGMGFPAAAEIIHRCWMWELHMKTAQAWEHVQSGIRRNTPVPTQWFSLKRFGLPIIRVDQDAMRLMTSCPCPESVPLWTPETTPKFQTTLYVLPEGALHADGEPVQSLAVTIMTAQEFVTEHTRIYRDLGHEAQDLPIPEPRENAEHFVAVTAHTQSHNNFTATRYFRGEILDPNKTTGEIDPSLTTGELAFTHRLVSFGIQLLLLAGSHPEFDAPERTETEHTGSGRIVKRWYPPLVGANLKTLLARKNTQTGNQPTDRKRPSEHWRGSHWKNVAYGPERSLRKLKLIMPCIVNFGIE